MENIPNIGTPEREAQIILEQSDSVNRIKFGFLIGSLMIMTGFMLWAVIHVSQTSSVLAEWIIGQ